MPPPFDSPVLRLRVHTEEPAIVTAPRPPGSRRPHGDATLAKVRRLIEETPLNYAEIAARTGVARASICRWTRDGGWKRPPFAPRATDTIPRERASAKLKRRTLAARLQALAERHLRELEDSAAVDPDKLAEALELLKMIRLAARPKRRRSAAEKLADGTQIFESSPRGVMQGLRAAGVRVERAPEDALEDFIASRAPKPERMSKRQREHARMLERE